MNKTKRIIIFLSLFISCLYLAKAINLDLSSGDRIDILNWEKINNITSQIDLDSDNLNINSNLISGYKICVGNSCLGECSSGYKWNNSTKTCDAIPSKYYWGAYRYPVRCVIVYDISRGGEIYTRCADGGTRDKGTITVGNFRPSGDNVLNFTSFTGSDGIVYSRGEAKEYFTPSRGVLESCQSGGFCLFELCEDGDCSYNRES